ncbi:hypothetical protein H0486_06805 [Lachnospiraceae bacterium MD1]|jgi:hypothetical protein|uniref:Uncharacterized protein n=1 Tax=Variimorphobacter saccharofermentans TaxID=2755051 RepID=A0A839K1J5_9FIRM|nr:hypothetical protein [Variimorphobacter saccharofermentans]MBB2182581.1 hypothetical protein [Variimorphobacter saccharofermentans]
MSDPTYRYGSVPGSQPEKHSNSLWNHSDANDAVNKLGDKDSDLVIEDNTVYEIDRECYERLKRQKRYRK